MKYHIDTIPVWDAMKLDGECLLCALERKTELGEADRYLGASVMEPDTRIQVNEKGFCLAVSCAKLSRKTCEPVSAYVLPSVQKRYGIPKPDLKIARASVFRIWPTLSGYATEELYGKKSGRISSHALPYEEKEHGPYAGGYLLVYPEVRLPLPERALEASSGRCPRTVNKLRGPAASGTNQIPRSKVHRIRRLYRETSGSFRLIPIHLHACFQQLHGECIRIPFLIHNPLNACVDNHLCTDGARLMRTVQVAPSMVTPSLAA